MLVSGLSAAPLLLLLLLQGALLLDAKPTDEKPYKIDKPFIKKFRHDELSRQKRFLDGFFKDIFKIGEQEFLNTDWKGNIFNNHHQIYNPYVPNIPQYYPGWSMATDACILSHNKKVSVVSSIRECQIMCLQEASFICRAVEYEPYSGTCSLTDGTSASADYVQPCTQNGWLFIERINDWTEPTYACIYNTHKKIIEEKVWSLDDCKTRCIDETSFECRSLGYIWWSQTCSLSPEDSHSPNFMMPCSIEQYIYLERLYVSPGEETITPSSNPCSADPCGPNSVCFPNGNSYYCQCADGFTGIPPNCNLYQDVCEDKSPNCAANKFLCTTNLYVQDNCKKTCNLCNSTPDCKNQHDCPSTHACVGWKCLDPCVDRCGENANCQVYNHYPSCTCQENYTGNPYLYCSEIAVTTTTEKIESNNTTITELPVNENTTITELPGCVNQSDCPSNRACVGGFCLDPCVARCGPNTECQVHNGQGYCSCSANYTGNPYLACSEIENSNTTTELPEDKTEATTEESQVIETTVAVESQTDTNDEESATEPQKEQDSDSTEAPIAPTAASTEPAVTEASLTDVTEASLTDVTEASLTDVTEVSLTEVTEASPTEVTETSLTEVTDSQEEITTVDPEARRRIEFPDFNR